MSETEKIPEIEKIVDHCLIFDVDGVLTDPVRKEITTPEGIKAIAERLQRGEPVILNTGRAVDFVRAKIIKPLVGALGNRTLLRNVLAVGEKGAVVMYFDNNGNEQLVVDETISIPAHIQAEARRITEEQYGDSMFFDDTKRTMVSIEMHDRYDLSKFQEAQKKLITELEALINTPEFKNRLRVDPSTIATDIQDVAVGKALGVRKALWWLGEKNVSPKEFLTFGDSQGDLAMAEELARLGKPTRFVFVGEPNKLKAENAQFPIVQTSDKYERGVAEFLKQLK